jgi:hypothetical protein
MDQSTRFKRAVPMEFVIYLGTRHYTQIGLQVLVFYHKKKQLKHQNILQIITFFPLTILLKSKIFNNISVLFKSYE